jgi:hypothetical protein
MPASIPIKHGGTFAKPRANPAASKLLSQNDRSLLIQADQMQRVLARIDANGAGGYRVCLL